MYTQGIISEFPWTLRHLTLSNFFCSISIPEYLLHKFNNQILFAFCYILTYTNLHLFVDKYVGLNSKVWIPHCLQCKSIWLVLNIYVCLCKINQSMNFWCEFGALKSESTSNTGNREERTQSQSQWESNSITIPLWPSFWKVRKWSHPVPLRLTHSLPPNSELAPEASLWGLPLLEQIQSQLTENTTEYPRSLEIIPLSTKTATYSLFAAKSYLWILSNGEFHKTEWA